MSLSFSKSIYLLIAVNTIPIWGILFDDWSVLNIVFLYWAENIVIGFYNVFKMFFSAKSLKFNAKFAKRKGLSAEQIENAKKHTGLAHFFIRIFRLPMIAFFVFHYGAFCGAHGLFVFTILQGNEAGKAIMNTELTMGVFVFMEMLFNVLRYSYNFIVQEGLIWPVLALFVSHGYSFIVNYIGRNEYKEAEISRLMNQPYARIMLLHVVIIFGGGIVMAFKLPIYFMMLFVAAKTVVDIYLHNKERKKFKVAS